MAQVLPPEIFIGLLLLASSSYNAAMYAAVVGCNSALTGNGVLVIGIIIS